MVQDSRGGNGLIALALLKPGWEPDYHGCPAIYEIGCAGRLVEVVDLPDSHYNIRLAGVSRVHFESFDVDYPYRVARIRPLPEKLPPEGGAGVQEARMGLVGAYSLLVSEITGQPATGLEGAVSAPFHALVNTFCAYIDLPPATKQGLLGLDDVLERCRAVTALIQSEVERLGQRRTGSGPRGAGGQTVH
jgi:Lon protease-like protein